MITTNVRILNDKTWKKFKVIAARKYLSANGLLNSLIEDYVEKNTQKKEPEA